MASSFTLESSVSYKGRYMYVTCTQTKDIANNRSKIDWTLVSTGGSSNFYATGPTTVTINGTQVYYKEALGYSSQIFPTAAGSTSGTIYVNHDNEGKATITVSLATAIYYSYVSDENNKASGTWVLDDIPRKATLTAAPNFYDTANPTITYSNPAGNSVTTLQACISLDTDATNIAVAYQNLSKTGTSYTFTLTDAQRNTLRNSIPNKNSRTVYFIIKTVIGGVTYTHSLSRTFTITAGEPTMSPTAKDTSSVTKALTGDENKLIRYFSDVLATMNATAIKGSSLAERTIVNGKNSVSAASTTFSNVEDNKFTFTAVDSRGNSTIKTLTLTMVNYIKLTCNYKASIAVDGNATVTVSGNYFNGSFGAVNNTLSVNVRYKPVNGEYSSWVNIPVTISGNTYSGSVEITGFNYQTTYTFQAEASDKLMAARSGEQNAKALPVFDWGENDFNFNVPVNMEEGFTIAGKAGLEVGTWTPKLVNGTTDTATGIYLRSGNICIVNWYIAASPPSSSEYVKITGLPFTPVSNIQWQSGGGTCSGHAQKVDAHFCGWALQTDGYIYGRLSHYNGLLDYASTSSGTILASGTLMYKIAA